MSKVIDIVKMVIALIGISSIMSHSSYISNINTSWVYQSYIFEDIGCMIAEFFVYILLLYALTCLDSYLESKNISIDKAIENSTYKSNPQYNQQYPNFNQNYDNQQYNHPNNQDYNYNSQQYGHNYQNNQQDNEPYNNYQENNGMNGPNENNNRQEKSE